MQFIPVGEHPIKIGLPFLQKRTQCEDISHEDIWMTSVVDRYKKRPQTMVFDEMCLASFISE